MSTLAEIEAAIVTLTLQEMTQLEDFLREQRTKQAEQMHLEELARRNGFNPFPRRATGAVVTTELVRQICEDEGI